MKKLLFPFVCLALLSFTKVSVTNLRPENSISTQLETFQLTGFSVINADTDEVISTIGIERPKILIPSDDLQGVNLNVRADYSGNNTDVIVQFEYLLSGNIITDTSAPYSLFEENNGNFEGQPFPDSQDITLGYLLEITAYRGSVSPENRIQTFIAEFLLFQIKEGLILRDASIDGNDLSRGFFTQSELSSPSSLLISSRRGLSLPSFVQSVDFTLEGPITVDEIVNGGYPHSVFGSTNGSPNRRIFPPGEYTLTATSFSELDGQGLQGNTRKFTFLVFPDNLKIDEVQVVSRTQETEGIFEFRDIRNRQEIDRGDESGLFINPSSFAASFDNDLVKSVTFKLTGPIAIKSVENIEPFALFGDNQGDFNLQQFPVGEYTLEVTPYSGLQATGLQGFPRYITFTITDEFKFTGFTVINADTDIEIPFRNISNNMIIDSDGLENTRLAVRADFSGNRDGVTIEFKNDFDEVVSLERNAPYALFGNNGNDYYGEIFTPRSTFAVPNVNKIIAYQGSPEEGNIIDEIETRFYFTSLAELVKLREPTIGLDRFFPFVNGTYELGGRLSEDGITEITVLDRLNLDAPRLINSVSFNLTGPVRYSAVENNKVQLRFSLFGFTERVSNTRQLVPGDYVFTAIPYTQKDAQGYQGEELRVEFSIVERASGQNQIVLSPNPANLSTSLSVAKDSKMMQATIFNAQGRQMKKLNRLNSNNLIDTSTLPVGYYYVKTKNDKGEVTTKKLLIQR